MNHRNSPRPMIAVTVSIDQKEMIRKGREYIYLARDYSFILNKCGAVPVYISPDTPVDYVVSHFDGLVITGGDDIDPKLYGQSALDVCYEAQERVEYEQKLIDLFSTAQKPLLGICYGMQLLNVHFGGTLHQSLPNLLKANTHGGRGVATEHRIHTTEGSNIAKALGQTVVVSSFHYQGIDRVAEGFIASATADDGVVEAIERDSLIGVEWHPERDSTAKAIYSYFLQLISVRQ